MASIKVTTESQKLLNKTLTKRSFNVKFDLEDTDYQAIENIGIGAYGVVCSAIHKKSQDRVAIKKIPCVFDAKVITKRTYREIKILKHFKHDNIICIREILKPKEAYDTFNEIYVVFDLMESDLHKIIYSDQKLTEEHMRYFLFQLFRGLKYIHSANVVHRDLKPSNILINEDCHLRIGDFGMARGVFSTPEVPQYYMTQYVATRWYRAPEILLSLIEYGTAVDMWSVGCIFAEMLGQKHIFPGKDYISQLKLIIGVLGSPSDSLLKSCTNEIICKMIKSFGPRQPIPWTTLFPKASKKSLDLLNKILVLNPAERITVESALQHPYLAKYHDPDDEPICVPAFNFDFEKEDMNKDQLREAIYKEIMEFHQPRTPNLSFSAVLRPVPKSDSSSDETEEGSPEGRPQNDLVQQQTETDPLSNTGAGDDGSVFKKPLTKKSPVSLDANLLQVSKAADVEMLSAKSVEMMSAKSVDMKSAQPVDMKSAQSLDMKQEMGTQIGRSMAKETGKENKGLEIKTISNDTKAIIKQALINQRRQRTESCGDDKDEKHRPVTALQRQKEREEKRMKKKKRAYERAQRLKEKGKATQTGGDILTDADKELLKRWTIMQKPAERKILPKMPTNDNSQEVKTSLATSDVTQSTGLVAPSRNQTASQDTAPIQQPVTSTQMPSMVSVTYTMGQSSTPFGQQQILQMGSFQSTAESHVTVNTDPHRSPPPQSNLQTNPLATISQTTNQIASGYPMLQPKTLPLAHDQTLVSSLLPANTTLVHEQFTENVHLRQQQLLQTPHSLSLIGNEAEGGGVNVGMSGHIVSGIRASAFSGSEGQLAGSIHSVNPFSTMPMGPLMSHQQAANFLPSVEQLQEQPYISLPRGNEMLRGMKNVQEQQLDEAGYSILDLMGINFIPMMDSSRLNSENFGQLLSTQNIVGSSVGNSLFGHPTNTVPSNHSSNMMSQQSDCMLANASLINSQSLSGMPSHTVPMISDQAPAMILSQNMTISGDPSMGMVGDGCRGMLENQELHHQSVQRTLGPAFQQHRGPNYSPPHAYHIESSPERNFTEQGSPDNSHYHQTADFTAPPQRLYHGMSSIPDQGSTEYRQIGTSQERLNQHFRQQNDSLLQGKTTSVFHGQATPLHSLMQQQQHASVPGLRIACGSEDKARNAGLQQQDLIAMLSSRLSKSQVVDVIPPLALTPRGTGAGYGVGMDLDALLVDSQENNDASRVEQSPLSSSLLADWLELSENISLADLEALDMHMQSPTLYQDMSMYRSSENTHY